LRQTGRTEEAAAAEEATTAAEEAATAAEEAAAPVLADTVLPAADNDAFTDPELLFVYDPDLLFEARLELE